MKYFGLFASGQEHDNDLANIVQAALTKAGDRIVFESKEDCIKATDEVKKDLALYKALKYEWLNGWDKDYQESVVFCVSRATTMPYAIGYLHFYKSRN